MQPVGGSTRDAAPSHSKYFHFHAALGKNLTRAPRLGNPESATANHCYLVFVSVSVSVSDSMNIPLRKDRDGMRWTCDISGFATGETVNQCGILHGPKHK